MKLLVTVKNSRGEILTGEVTKYEMYDKDIHILFDNDDGYSKTVPKKDIMDIKLRR